MMKFRHALLPLLLVFILSTFVFAGVTGKIRGMVRDAANGDPLPGVNVIVSHTWNEGEEYEFTGNLGAATDINGEYIILRVPPGRYSLTAQMMGYSPMTMQRVQVSVDRTIQVDFELNQTVIQGQEIVVESKRDVIQLDVSATESYVTEEQYQATPFANRIEDVIGMQSGVSGNVIEGTIKIREGEAHELGYLMDGMEITDKKFNRPVMSIQPGMVEEIKIMRNGFNAEYGQSRSGVINVVSKTPSERVHFTADYQFSPAQKPHYGRNKYDPNYRREWRLMDGPNAFTGDTLYIPNGLHETKYTWEGWNRFSENLLNDNNPDNDLTPDEAYELWKWRHRPVEYGNLTGHNIDLTLSGKTPLVPWTSTFLLGTKYEFHPFDYPMSRDHYDERSGNLKMVNTLSPNMKLIMNAQYSEVRTVTEGSSKSEWSEEDRISYNGDGFPNYYPFYKPVIDRYATIIGGKLTHTLSPTRYYEVNLNHFYVKWHMGRPPMAPEEKGRMFHGRLYLDPQSGWIPKEFGVPDEASGYQMYGGAYTWDNSYNRRTKLTASYTDQINSSNELKAGLEYSYNILREDRLHWHNDDPNQKFTRDYKVFPVEAGVYLQDKIEFQGMIANVGLRFDYFNVNTTRPNPHRALEYDTNRDIQEAFSNGTYPTYRTDPKTYFSPRVGISHPLSDRSKIYFNYGHFVSTPSSLVLYHVLNDWSMPRITFMGNPDIDFPKTIAYEIGADFNLSDFFQLHVGAFYKDNTDFESGMVYAHSDQSLVMEWYDQNDYKEIRGLEIEIRKSVGRFITGWINYNYIKKSEANLEIPNLSDIPIVTDDPNIGRNGVLWGVPRSDISVLEPWAKGVITFTGPPEWGPKLFDHAIFGDANLSLQVHYQGGPKRRHPRSSFRDTHPDVWFQELDRYWANMRFSKLFRIKSSTLEFYTDISNVLHTKFRNPPGGISKEEYYDDLWESGRLDEVGTDELSNPKILRTESDDVYWARVKRVIMGFRLSL
jgi:hypothetical protein